MCKQDSWKVVQFLEDREYLCNKTVTCDIASIASCPYTWYAYSIWLTASRSQAILNLVQRKNYKERCSRNNKSLGHLTSPESSPNTLTSMLHIHAEKHRNCLGLEKNYLLHDSMSLCTSHFPWDLQTTYNYTSLLMASLRVLDSKYCKFSTSLGMCIYCVPATVWMCLEFSFVIFAYLSQETEASLTTREAGSKSKTCFCKGHRCFAANLYITVWIMMQLQIEVHLQLDPQQNQVKQVKTRGHCKLKVLAQVNNCPLNSSN